MRKNCKKITPQVSKAGRKLATSSSKAVRSAAGKILAEHKAKNH